MTEPQPHPHPHQSASRGASDAATALAITENIPVGTYVMAVGPEGLARFTFVSERWLRMLQLERQAVLADPSLAFERFHPDELAAFSALHNQAVAEKKPLFWEGRLQVEGVTSWVRIESNPRPNPAGETIWEGVMVDITSQQQVREELERERALLDTVLSHINAHVYMRHLQQMVNQALERADRYGEVLSLILCDIDNFKAINDLHGHHIGDQVLIDFSRRILRQLRRSDAFGRWGGEEFLLLLPSTGGAAALALAERLPEQSQDAWLQRVDAALYAAKAAGRNAVHAA